MQKCVCPSMPTCSPLGPRSCGAGCLLLLPVGEEQGSDTACPFNSLATFDMRRAEVSLTYFPLAALLLSGGAPQRGGVHGGRSCLRLHCCPGLLNHCHLLGDTFQCLCVFTKSVGGIPHTQARAHTHVLRLNVKALWQLQVDAGQNLGRTPAVSSV